MTIKIFADPKSFVKDKNVKPLHIIEAQISDLTHEEKITKYGKSYTEFALVDRIEQADLAIMPYDLQTCIDLNIYDSVFQFADEAYQAGKNFIIWTLIDDCLAPKYHKPGIITFAETGFQSLRSEKEFCSPWFAMDPLPLYFNNELPTRNKGEKPVIGFCGRATFTLSRFMWQSYRNTLRTIKTWANTIPFSAPRILSEVSFRSKILHDLEVSDLVETDFILHQRYFAGVEHKSIAIDDPQHPAKLVFINNMFNTDYTVCLRGSGNWSMRLYETLSCGRIPIFVNTDCILPYDFAVDWHDYVVWVEQHEVPHIAEKVADFHASISNDDFIDLQKACRKLWTERLSRDGFFAHFHEHLNM